MDNWLIRSPHLSGERPDVVFIEQVPEGANRHLEQFGCPRLIAPGFPKGLYDVGFFEVFQVVHQIDTAFWKIKLRTYSLRIIVCNMIGQLFRLDLSAAFQGDSAFDGVLKLTDVGIDHIFRDILISFAGIPFAALG